MLHSRAIQCSLAAVTAVACILGPASSATGAAAGFGGLLHGQKRCCSPVAAGEGIASGVERAGAAPAPLRGADPAWGGLALAQTSEPQDEETAPDGAGVPSGEDEGTTGTPRTQPEAGLEDTYQTFEGSAKPVGPDLTLPEEQQLISSGWN